MLPLIQKLRQDVHNAESQLRHAQVALDQYIQACQHQWAEPVHDDIVVTGHMTPDFMARVYEGQTTPEVWVPEQRTERWKRVCYTCGKEEHTTKVNETVTKTPAFGATR